MDYFKRLKPVLSAWAFIFFSRLIYKLFNGNSAVSRKEKDMEMLATVNFIFHGKGWTKSLERYAEEDFFWYNSRFTDIFNEHIKEINDEWDRLYKGNKNEYMGDDMVVIYNHFVAAKMERYLMELNVNEILGSGWICSIDPETAICRIYLEQDLDSYLDFEIEFEGLPKK